MCGFRFFEFLNVIKKHVNIFKNDVLKARGYVDRALDHHLFIIRQKGVDLRWALSGFMKILILSEGLNKPNFPGRGGTGGRQISNPAS